MKIHIPFIAAITYLTAPLITTAQTTDPDLGDHPEFAHAMKVETKKVDGVPVVFHYNQVRPDFDNLTTNHTRNITKLSGKNAGTWKFRFDPNSVGTTQKWHQPTTTKDWLNVTVPHCWDAMPGGKYWDWNDQTPDNPPHYNGASWYQKTFQYQPKQGNNSRQRIVFLGVQQRARVFLNGHEIAQHEGGGAPFSIDASEHIKTGTNTLALKVLRLPNYIKHPEGKGDKGWQELDYTHTLHPKAPDCWPYAGILRDVYLIEEAPVTIRKSLINPTTEGLNAVVIISNHGDTPLQLRSSMSSTIDPQTTTQTPYFTIAPHQTIAKHMLIKGGTAKAKPWSPTSPQLYTASFQLQDKTGKTIDNHATQFGVRTFVTDGPTFKLNNKSIFLKGASIYDEHPERGGAITPQDHRDHYKLLHDSNSNFARLHVTQRDPYSYKLANEQGILVCGEWGGFWYKEKSMLAQTQDPHSIYQTMARCAVWDMLNHPSVVLWGLNNECHQFCEEYDGFLKMTRELVREIDYQKRPITWSAWHPHKGQPHFEHADAVGFNEYRGAMDPFDLLDPDMKKVITANPNKPIIIMENGAWSKRGSRGPITKKSNENWQADLLKRQWEVLTKHTPHFSGYTYWLLKDYRSRKPYTGSKNKNGYSRMGIYDEHNLPKKLVRDAFQNLEIPSNKK
ncbi:MAG: glycoside hydrolase family 2 protein [Akkermansiaceae bacterium]